MNQHYSIKELTEAEFKPLFNAHKESVFEDFHGYDIRDVLSDAERQQIKGLEQAENAYKLYLGVFDGDDNFVGWSWGQQENASTFYMVNSGVLKEHRRKGLYSRMLLQCLEILSQKGFQLIYSRHSATNNDVIIPKLKAGFIISKMEISDKFGILIHLHFYTNEYRRRIMDYRSGKLKPDAKIKELFKI